MSASDFDGDPGKFEARLDIFLDEAEKRKCHSREGGNRQIKLWIPIKSFGNDEKGFHGDDKSGFVRLGYIGVPPIFSDLYEVAEKAGARVVLNEVQRQFSMPYETGDLYEQYARYTYPYDVFGRIRDIKEQTTLRRMDGIIHYCQSFCFRAIEDLILRRELKIPVLTIEGDRPGPGGREDAHQAGRVYRNVKGQVSKMKRCGMDLGSRQVKLVLIEDGGAVLKKSFDTAAFYREYGRRPTDGELSVDMTKLGLPEDVPLTVTGYGRNAVKVKGAQVISEVKAHALGAVFQTGLSGFVLLDIGGQDTKVVKVSGGRMEDFTMNDKCAASSGRYIENMANVLDMSLDEISNHYAHPVHLSATCAIFGESEIIQKMTEGKPPEHIAAGINLTVVKRVLPMLARFPDGPVVFAGGVARNAAVALFHQGKDGPRPRDRPRPVIQRCYRLRDIR